MTLKDGYRFGGFSGTPPSEPIPEVKLIDITLSEVKSGKNVRGKIPEVKI